MRVSAPRPSSACSLSFASFRRRVDARRRAACRGPFTHHSIIQTTKIRVLKSKSEFTPVVPASRALSRRLALVLALARGPPVARASASRRVAFRTPPRARRPRARSRRRRTSTRTRATSFALSSTRTELRRAASSVDRDGRRLVGRHPHGRASVSVCVRTTRERADDATRRRARRARERRDRAATRDANETVEGVRSRRDL